MITQAELKEKVDYNPDTGLFVRKDKKNTVWALTNTGYLRITLKNKEYLQHRLAWLYVYGSFPKDEIDHINGIRSDNRICNLRDVSHRENLQNQTYHRNGKLAGCRYVSKIQKWRSRIVVNGKRYEVGVFKTEEEASKAYLEASGNLELFLQKKNSRKVTNIYFNRKTNRYIARKMINRITTSIGTFKTEAEALEAVARFVEVNAC